MVKTVKDIANTPLGTEIEPKSRRCSFLRAAKSLSVNGTRGEVVQKRVKEKVSKGR